LDDSTCDPLGDGIGLAKWMFGLGVCQMCSVVIQIINSALMSTEDWVAGKQYGPLSWLVGLIQLGLILWTIYGVVATFDSGATECPTEVYDFAYWYLIIVFVSWGLVILVLLCVMAVLCAAQGPIDGTFATCVALYSVFTGDFTRAAELARQPEVHENAPEVKAELE